MNPPLRVALVIAAADLHLIVTRIRPLHPRRLHPRLRPHPRHPLHLHRHLPRRMEAVEAVAVAARSHDRRHPLLLHPVATLEGAELRGAGRALVHRTDEMNDTVEGEIGAEDHQREVKEGAWGGPEKATRAVEAKAEREKLGDSEIDPTGEGPETNLKLVGLEKWRVEADLGPTEGTEKREITRSRGIEVDGEEAVGNQINQRRPSGGEGQTAVVGAGMTRVDNDTTMTDLKGMVAINVGDHRGKTTEDVMSDRQGTGRIRCDSRCGNMPI